MSRIPDLLADINLLHYASEATQEMDFSDTEELEEAVKRAYNLCVTAGIPVKGNFKRVYKSSYDGMICDWKLSVLAYRLVCLNGDSCNRNVAQMQIRLLKNEQLNYH